MTMTVYNLTCCIKSANIFLICPQLPYFIPAFWEIWQMNDYIISSDSAMAVIVKFFSWVWAMGEMTRFCSSDKSSFAMVSSLLQ